jgi:hypothetical protein
MRRISSLACSLSLFLIATIQMAVAAPSNQGCGLPAGLREEISNKYPGTRLVGLADLQEEDEELFRKEHGSQCPGLARVDFYGDGKPTLALVLLHDETSGPKAELVLAHQRRKAWEIKSLDTADASPVPVVWREGPNNYNDVYGQKTINATKPVIVLCGYGGWAILYAWAGKRVEKIWLSD